MNAAANKTKMHFLFFSSENKNYNPPSEDRIPPHKKMRTESSCED